MNFNPCVLLSVKCENKIREMEKEKKAVEFVGVCEKLKGGILLRKREGNSTPSPNWKFGLVQADGSLIQEPNFLCHARNSSARKLGANLWELQPLMSNNRGTELKDQKELEGPLPSGVKLRKQITESVMQHTQRVKSVGEAQQPLSPASYSSSMEMAPRRPAISPSGSMGSIGKLGESNYHLKTSNELLKVLNRIWSLEEKHALDMSLVRALRKELEQSQARVQELLQEKKRDHKQIDKLVKQITDNKVSKENNEQDKIIDAVKLARKELEHERKLRRHSEKLCDKLARELSGMKSLLANSLRENEWERRARRLLEDLCDEFAKGVIVHEQEVRFLKQKSAQDQVGKEGSDRLILHISEAWLDERMQMKLADGCDMSEKPSVLEKLGSEIETFLHANHTRKSEENEHLSSKKASQSNLPAHSSESLHLNEPGSAPWNDKDDSAGMALHNSQFRGRRSSRQYGIISQQEKNSLDDHSGEAKRKPTKQKVQSRKVNEGSDLPNFHTHLEENINDRKMPPGIVESSNLDAGNLDVETSKTPESRKFYHKSSHTEGSFDPSMFTGLQSPVKKWTTETTAAADPTTVYESSSRWPQSLKPNTLKAKLLEARIEGQQSRGRTLKGLLRVD